MLRGSLGSVLYTTEFFQGLRLFADASCFSRRVLGRQSFLCKVCALRALKHFNALGSSVFGYWSRSEQSASSNSI